MFTPIGGHWYCWKLNGTSAYLQKDGNLWRTAFDIVSLKETDASFKGPHRGIPGPSLPVSLVFDEGEDVSLHPYLSDRPYLATVKENVRIPVGFETHFTASLPPLLKFERSNAGGTTEIGKAMSFNLKETWFGSESTVGILCYSLSEGLVPIPDRKDGKLPAFTPSAFIHCTIIIKNQSKNSLELNSLVIHPASIGIYEHSGCLFTDTLEFDFLGVELKMKTIPIKDEKYHLITPGAKSSEILFNRSIDIVREITRL
jgi:hypothetical protein